MTKSQTFICMFLLAFVTTGAQIYLITHDVWLSESTSRLYYFVLSFLVAILIETDRKLRGRPAPFEFAAFVFFAWPVVAPYYFFSVMGWRGLAASIGLFGLALLPDMTALLLW